MNIKFILAVLFLTIFSSIKAQDLSVSNISEYKEAIKSINSGGTIILKNGVWKDAKLEAYGNGTKESPIIVKAETPGQVVLSGDSSLKIYGTHVIVSGLWFKDGSTTSKYVVQFKKNNETFANNCRFTNSTISNFDIKDKDGDLKNHWVDLWGKNNRVDHNNFTGKTSAGTTLVVWLKGDQHVENNHKIDYNFFGPRPDLGENGGETIRIGTSANSMKSSKTLVENNTFKNCDGEIEIVSNKSGDNVFRNNLFIESKGTLTLRHGNNALVENNVFLGNNVSNTGGIRIINEGHIVRNNLLVGLKGNGYRGPIVIMNGVPNSPLNRYHRVKNVEVVNNTIINCGPITFGAGKDNEKSLAPINSVFANNIITNTDGSIVFQAEDDISGVRFLGNIVDSQASVDASLFTKTTIDWKTLKALPMPSENNPALKAVTKTSKASAKDIVDTDWTTYVAGAFNLENTKYPRALKVKTGPGWTPVIDALVADASSLEILLDPGAGKLRKTISKVQDGSVIKLKSGTYYIDKQTKVNKSITIQGDINGETIIMASETLEKPINYLFRVSPGATLNLNNVTVDGSNRNPLKYAIVSPDKMESELYNLSVKNCVFRNFTNKRGGAIFKAYIGTRADAIIFENSRFEDSYRGLNLSYEEDLGKFNANSLTIINSVFLHIDQFAINYTRPIGDPNIKGGELTITNCVFDKVANTEKGKIIKTKGIHKVSITNSVFQNSYLVKNPVDLSGSSNSISNCLIHDSGYVKVTKSASEKDMIYKNPKWEDKKAFIPSAKSPLLKSNNGVDNIGLMQ